MPGVWGVWRQCAGPAPLGGLGWGSLGAGASLGGAWVPALPWRWRPRWASRPAPWGRSWSPTAPPYPTPSVKGGPSEASPHPCHFRWSPQDPSSAALSLPHDSHQAPGAPGLPGQANQAPHSFQTLPLKAWPGGVLKGLRPSPRAGPGCPPPGGGGRPPPTPAAPSHCLKHRDGLPHSWGPCSSTHKVVPESCVGRAGSEPVCPARPSPQCLPWRKVSPRRGRGARGPHLVSWGPALLPGAGFSGHACSHVGAPSLQGEAGPPGLPGPPVSVLLC